MKAEITTISTTPIATSLPAKFLQHYTRLAINMDFAMTQIYSPNETDTSNLSYCNLLSQRELLDKRFVFYYLLAAIILEDMPAKNIYFLASVRDCNFTSGKMRTYILTHIKFHLSNGSANQRHMNELCQNVARESCVISVHTCE